MHFFLKTNLSYNFYFMYDIIVLVIIMIKENRLKRGFSQEKLSELIDISWRQLQRIEKSEEETTVKTLKKLVKELNIPDKEILEYIKKQN